MRIAKQHPLYSRWKNMRQRCNSTTCKDYPNYGGRGIKLCDRWDSFWNFVEDMYPTFVDGMTIERMNVDGGYNPENCIWIPNEEQAHNRRSSHILTCDGMSMNIKQWSVYAGVDRTTIYDRLSKPHLTTRQVIFGIKHK